METHSDEVRRYVLERYILPARRKGETSVQVRSGNIHSELHWVGRVPLVCQALGSQKFQREAGVELVERSRPGPSTTVVFTYRFLDRDPSQEVTRPSCGSSSEPKSRKQITLLDLYGVAKEIFGKLGGGEAFLREIRTGEDPDPWERFEIDKALRRKAGSN